MTCEKVPGPAPMPAPGLAARPAPVRPTTLLSVFFSAALAMLAAAGVLALLHVFWGVGWGRWPILHLALLGGVSQLVIGAAQFFVAAFLSTEPPPRSLIAAQWLAWNAGVLVVVASSPLGMPGLAEGGTVLILLGLAAFCAGLLVMRKKSLQHFHWATRWYSAAAAFLVPGVLAGAAMASGVGWPHGSLLGAHLALNLLGWFGTAIVGTLHTLFPSLSGSKLRFPGAEPYTFSAWLGGVALLAAGLGFGWTPAASAGWLLLLVAAVLLGVNLAGTIRGGPRPLRLSLRMVAAGQLYLPVAFSIALGAGLADGRNGPFQGWPGDVLPVLLLAGWIGLTVAGSLLHLMAMLARVRSGFSFAMPEPRPRLDTGLAAGAVAGLSIMAIASALELPALELAGRIIVLAALLAVVVKIVRAAAMAFKGGRSASPPFPPVGPGR